MRFCAHCGARIPDNAKFCGACGTSIDTPDEATVTFSDPEEPAGDTEPQHRQPEKKKGLSHYVWLFLKVLIIAILAVFLAVFLRGVYLGYTSSDKTQAVSGQVQENRSPARNDLIPSGSQASDDDSFESIDDLPLQDRAEYWEALLDRSYESLKQEERKGDAADDARILELVLAIEDLHSQLDQLAQ